MLATTASHAFDVAPGAMAFSCSQPTPETLACDYIPTAGGVAENIQLQLEGKLLRPSASRAYQPLSGRTAVLFSIDTSDPARRDVVRRNAEHVTAMLDIARPQHSFGLARFDSQLELLEPVGSSAENIRIATGRLQATGPTTELFRAAKDAIRVLADVDADRRLLVLFSDGLAEDHAYDNDDVVRDARDAGVMIMTLGYARSIPQSTALQTLQRLSEETGGPHVRADAYGNLPDAFMAAPFASIDGGGTVEFDLTDAIAPGTEVNASLVMRMSGRTHRLGLLLQGPKPLPVTATETIREIVIKEPVAKSPTSQPAATVTPPQAPVVPAEGSRFATWVWFGTPAAFLLVVIVALALYGIALPRRGDGGPRDGEPKPFAYFVRNDKTNTRYVVTRSPWRIGRSRNNELTLDDTSVSRQHAEVSRSNNGSFLIRDLDSLNGVFVNEKKVVEAELSEGDSVEIGDIGLKFTIYEADPSAQEPTVMIQTQTPPPA